MYTMFRRHILMAVIVLHPKQYLTARDEFGYIGTDTTENFCSMIRWLDSSGMIIVLVTIPMNGRIFFTR